MNCPASLQPPRLGHLYLPRVHRPLPQSGPHRPRPQLGRPGRLAPRTQKPAWFLPISGRLYFRKSQLPVGPDGIVEFRTKCELAVELLREQARIVKGKHLAVFDGGYALESVVRPLVLPAGGAPGSISSPACGATLGCTPCPCPRSSAPRGSRPQPKWGQRLEPPRRGGMWKAKWQVGTAFVYGRQRTIRWKEIICLWRVLGWEVPVKVIVAAVEGYKERFTLVTSAVELTGLQMVELFAARFRQEDGFRDLKQRLGWEECRAWTANPIQRTSQAQWVTMSLLRLLQFRLEACGEVGWWFRPPWNKDKDRPSVLDAERLMRRHREQIQRLLSKWARNEGNTSNSRPLECDSLWFAHFDSEIMIRHLPRAEMMAKSGLPEPERAPIRQSGTGLGS